VELKDYRRRVKLLADLRNGGSIFNGSAEHASVIVENLFRVANHHVRILSDKLEARVYGNPNVVQRVEEFLAYSDHKLDVLVEDASFTSSHPFIRAVLDNKNVSIRQVDPRVATSLPYHFMTADEDCYRFEEVKGSHKAVAAFGNPAALNLANIFNAIEAHSLDINLPVQ